MLASSRTPRGTANALGGINPAPTNLPKPPAKPDGRNHPGVRRAGCPHPSALRGCANTPGGYGIRPYETAEAAGGYGTRPCTGFRRFGGAGEGLQGQKCD